MQESSLEKSIDALEQKIEDQRKCIQAFRWNLLRMTLFCQEIVRDANPQDPKILELEALYQSLFALKP